MKDAGWVGKFVNGRFREPDFTGPAEGRTALDAPPPRPVLYDAAGKPLARERQIGFVRKGA